MRYFILKMSFGLIFISQFSLILTVSFFSEYLIAFLIGLSFTVVSWVSLVQLIPIVKKNDILNKKINEANSRRERFKRLYDVLCEMALQKMGITVEEINKRLKS